MILPKLITLSVLVSSVYGNSCTITSFDHVDDVVKSCTTINVGTFTVPSGKTLIFNLKKGTHIKFTGTVTFGHYTWNGILMEIFGDSITGEATNGAIFNGQGEKYWDGKGGLGTAKPVFLYLTGSNSAYKNFHFKNCPERCIAVNGARNLKLSGWTIDNTAAIEGIAPKGKEGFNTDGFDINASNDVLIENANLITQDDCIAISLGSNIHVNKINCKYTHGLSIAAGLDPKKYDNNVVYNVTIENAVMENGINGIRIKTCNDGGPGKIDYIVYRNIQLKNVRAYGILLQQDYSYKKGGTSGAPKGNVPITDVRIENVSGTMSKTERSSNAVTITCAANACKNFVFNKIAITGAQTKNKCTNYKPTGVNC